MTIFGDVRMILREMFFLRKETRQIEENMATNEQISKLCNQVNTLSAAVGKLISGEIHSDPAEDKAVADSIQAGDAAIAAFNADQNPTPAEPAPVDTNPVDGTPQVPIITDNANPTAPALQ